MPGEAPPAATVRRRIAATGRPCREPECAGCAQLATLRALRRAGLAVQGALGCDQEEACALEPRGGRWAALAGVARLRDPARLLSETFGAGAHVLVIADRAPPSAAALDALVAGLGAPVLRPQAADPAGMEAALARLAAAPPGSIVLSLAPCARSGARGAPLSVVAARCNRCGACLSLGCAALADGGGESMVIDAALCTGCGLCAPLCRARAIG